MASTPPITSRATSSLRDLTFTNSRISSKKSIIHFPWHYDRTNQSLEPRFEVSFCNLTYNIWTKFSS